MTPMGEDAFKHLDRVAKAINPRALRNFQEVTARNQNMLEQVGKTQRMLDSIKLPDLPPREYPRIDVEPLGLDNSLEEIAEATAAERHAEIERQERLYQAVEGTRQGMQDSLAMTSQLIGLQRSMGKVMIFTLLFTGIAAAAAVAGLLVGVL